MKKILNAWPLFILLLLLTSCEEEEEENPPGYVISSLFEINGKKRTDRTGEVIACRRDEVWVFDLPNKQVTRDYIQDDCDGFIGKNGLLHPCDTSYVDSLRGSYLIMSNAGIKGLNSPPVHPEFPLELDDYHRKNKLYTLFYRLIKFDHKELVILNKFNPHQVPRDSQYFELTMKFVEK